MREEGEDKGNKGTEVMEWGQSMWDLLGHLMLMASTMSEMRCH